MNDHLTSQQISEYVAGAGGAAMDEHVRACATCRTQAGCLRETLALFRDAARGWSLEQESARPLVPVNLSASNNRRVALRYLGLAAAVAACLIAGLTLPRQRTIQPVPAISDAETSNMVFRAFGLSLFLTTALIAQPPGGGPGGRSGRGPSTSVERALQAGPSGMWWRDPALVQKIGLTADQQKKIEDAFQQSRLRLIDLTAALDKEQVTMEPLLAADRPDEAKILVQIDRIAQARAELEKADARMLLGFRNVLSQDQWSKLKAEQPAQPPPPQRGGPGR